MNKLLFLVFCVLLSACQEEEFTEISNQEESSFLLDEQLSGYMKSVASHDGSFDNRIDNSDCFSINFPYGLWVNGERHNMSSAEDLMEITSGAEVVPEFPVTITTADYVEVEVNSVNELQAMILDCHSGQMYDDIITCVDFSYPITISLYDTENSNFETVTLNHDLDTFSSIETLDPNRLASLNFPITLVLNNGNAITVTSNEDLKNKIFSIAAICN